MTFKYWAHIVVIAILFSTTQNTQAQRPAPAIKIEKIETRGNGCPHGTASTSTSMLADKLVASLSFADYVAEAGGHGQRSFARKKCDITFSITPPRNYQISLHSAAHDGFIDLPRRAKANFTRSYFMNDVRKARLTKSWRGRASRAIASTDNLNIWSPCGANVIFRAKTATTVRTRRGQPAMMDSGRVGFRYSFRYQACQ